MTSRGAIAAQTRVLAALIMREMATRFGRAWVGYFWTLGEPAAFIALLSLVFSQIAHQPPYGVAFPMFYATGYLGFALYHDMARITSRAVEANRPLLSYPAVSPLDLVLARFALQFLTALVTCLAILGAIAAVYGEPLALRLGALAQALSLGALLGLGVGLINTVLFALSKTYELIFVLASRPLFLVSAVFFSYEAMPPAVRDWLWWNPLVHVVGMVRRAVYPAYDGAHLAPGPVAALGLGLVLAGLVLNRGAGRRLAEAA